MDLTREQMREFERLRDQHYIDQHLKHNEKIYPSVEVPEGPPAEEDMTETLAQEAKVVLLDTPQKAQQEAERILEMIPIVKMDINRLQQTNSWEKDDEVPFQSMLQLLYLLETSAIAILNLPDTSWVPVQIRNRLISSTMLLPAYM